MPTAPIARLPYRLSALGLLLLTTACLSTPEAPATPVGASPTVLLATATAPPTRLAPTSTVALAPSTTPPAPATAVATQPPAPTAPPATPTPATNSSLLRSALSAMASVSSYHYTATVQAYDQGRPVQTAAEGDYRAPGNLRWVMSAGDITTTAVLTGNLYTVAVGSEAWTTLSGAATERSRQLAWQVIAQAQNVTEVGRDPVTSIEPTVHLSFTLPLTTVPLEAHPWKLAEGDVWVGLTDARVYAFKLHALEPNTEIILRMYLSAFNQPVSFAPPSAGPSALGLSGRLLYIRPAAGDAVSTLHIRDLATGGDSVVPDVEGSVEGAAWSPDGANLLYSAGGSLFRREPTGRVLNLGRGITPTWSPDGTTIAFIRSGQPSAIWLADPLLNTPRRLSTAGAQQITYVPDGSALVISGRPPGLDPTRPPAGLFRVNLDSGALQPLPPVAGGAAWPRFAPDGSRLAFVAGGHLALADPDGSGLTILEPTGSDSAPVWSPDGTLLIYIHRAAAAAPAELRVRPVDGGPAQPVPNSGDYLPCDWQ